MRKQRLILTKIERKSDRLTMHFACNFTALTSGEGYGSAEALRRVQVTQIITHMEGGDPLLLYVKHDSDDDIEGDEGFIEDVCEAFGIDQHEVEYTDDYSRPGFVVLRIKNR